MKKKTVTKEKSGRKALALIIIGAIIAAIALYAGISIAYSKLKHTYNLQCCITDADEQVEVKIEPGKIINPAFVINYFGLTNGVNLSQVPFPKLRSQLLSAAKELQDIRITKTLPNKISITALERVPKVRVLGYNQNFVADSEGVVFWYHLRLSATLPIIRQPKNATTKKGEKLSGMALSALWLLEEAADPQFSVLKIQEVDTYKKDYLLATLGDSSIVKIAWEEMDKDTKKSRAS
ncbi:MAG: hypothetical protein J6R18_08735, partial [Kiritimatiellae bacterium]|nr:hypothetical protein [Kiritimatiellia bacterium]